MTTYSSGTYNLTGVVGQTITAAVSTNSTVTFDLVGALSTFDISSSSGSTVLINDTVTVADVLNLDTNSGTIDLGTFVNAAAVTNVTLDGGGTYVVGATDIALLANTNGTYGTGGGDFVVGTAGTLLSITSGPTIHNFASVSDVIDDLSLAFSSSATYSIHNPQGDLRVVTVTDPNGDSFVFDVSGNAGLGGNHTYTVGTGPLHIVADSSGGTEINLACFLRGTRIATPEGERRVETLRAGDLVETRDGDATIARPVTWIGRRTVDMSDAPDAAYARDVLPVRIRAGAFGEGRPQRDLLLTQEHCIFVDGKLVPVRLLVNGASIVLDTSFTRYEYFHVELDRHAILVADGLETESYLDTGNRVNFANAEVSALHPDFSVEAGHARWRTDAAAPLATDEETVRPIWQRLADRAAAQGFAVALPAVTSDTGLHVVAGGRTCLPVRVAGDRYIFAIPQGADLVRLVSRAAAPAESAPWLDDRRKLGVAVRRITQRSGLVPVALAADDPRLSDGWYAAEHGECGPVRWTSGNAAIPVLPGAQIIEIELHATGLYTAGRESGARKAA